MTPALIPNIVDARTEFDASAGLAARFARDGYQPRPSDPVFFTLYPPPQIAERMRRLGLRLRDAYGLAEPPPDAERLHVSLCGLCRFGELTRNSLAAIGTAAASVRVPAFPIEFD